MSSLARRAPFVFVAATVTFVLGASLAACGGSDDSGSSDSLHISGGGSAQFRAPGDNSIQNYGEEKDESELEEAATVLYDYLVARTGEDWVAACSYLSKTQVHQFEHLASSSTKIKGKGCPPALDAFTLPFSKAAKKETTEFDAGSLRYDDDEEMGFLLYHGAKKTDYFMLMVREGDGWRVGAISPTPLT